MFVPRTIEIYTRCSFWLWFRLNEIVVYKKDGDKCYSSELLVDSSTELLVDELHSDPSYSDEVSSESMSEA